MSILDERGDTFRGTRAPAHVDPVGEMFASSSVPVHLVRGVLGLVLVVGGLVLTGQSAWSLLLVPFGVLAWRGCPTCWTLGLIATIARRPIPGATCKR